MKNNKPNIDDIHDKKTYTAEAGKGPAGKRLPDQSWASFGMKVFKSMLPPKTTVRTLESNEAESSIRTLETIFSAP